MALLDNVQKLVLQLDSKWFEAKKADFIREPFYNKGEDRIYETAPFKVDKDLISYCWNGNYPGGLYAHDEEQPLPVNASDIASKVVLAIDEATRKLNNDELKFSNIMEAMQTVRNMIEQMQEDISDDTHNDVLDFFLEELKKNVTTKWLYLKQAFNIYNAHRDVLYLDVKLDELAVLVKILDEAGIFHKVTKSDNAHLLFMARHFSFKNQRKEGSYTLASGLPKAVSAVANNDVSRKVISDMKSKLMKALQAIK